MTGEIKLKFDRDGYESFRFDEIARKISETVDPPPRMLNAMWVWSTLIQVISIFVSMVRRTT